MSVRMLFEKVELKQQSVTVSDTREVDLSIMIFRFAILFKTYTVNNAENGQNYVCKKNTSKLQALKRAKTGRQGVKNSKVLSPTYCLLILTTFRDRKF